MLKLKKIFYLYYFLMCLIEISDGESVYVVELQGGWTLTNQNLSISLDNLRIPSGVYSALNNNKDDVLHSYNDINWRWIAHDNWTYTRVFSIATTTNKYSQLVNITFDGIDTIAEIRLNHQLLGRTDNMFVRYSYDITKILEETNTLEVEIRSPLYAANATAAALEAIDKAVPPNCPPLRYHGECHMNLLRKMQASFGWDWGPAIPSMGIWKTVALEYYEVALIRDIDVITSKNSTHWNLDIRVYVEAGGRKDFYAEVTFLAVELIEKAVIISTYRKNAISYISPVITFEQSIPIDKVVLWWPNGYGQQKLYPLHFTLNAWLDPNGPPTRSKTISQKSIRIGFRTIELIEETLDNGDSFLFKINGEEIFMKGTNYIPSHILPEFSNDQDRIKNLLWSAKDANMNMIRVWGGGIYESNFFYDSADVYGLLIWQDMMFACAMYPITDNFLASVRQEVVQNIKRISHHPSIAIIATNNENEAALAGNWYGTLQHKSRFQSEYRELYLGEVVHELKIFEHSSRPRTLVSSPSNGKHSEKDNYISENPQDPQYGDIHFYEVFKDGWDANIYPRPRFASEYGYQSLPSMSAWERIVDSHDNLLDLITFRQHHPLAMIPILTLIHRHLPLPLPEEENYVEALIYFSQITQAMATKIETELYRSLRNSEHKTMGALYWQLNDVWIAPSWSSIDFNGNYKLLHYWAKEFMAPIAIIAHYDSPSKSLNISLVCDTLTVDTKNLEVVANIYQWSELFPKSNLSWPVTLKPNGVHYDKIIPIKELFTGRFTTSNSFVEFILQQDSMIISRTFYFPSPIRSTYGIQDPKITVNVSWRYCKDGVRRNSLTLTIRATRPAVFVYIEFIHPEIVQYKLSRNGFMMVVPVQIVHLEFDHNGGCVDVSSQHIKVLTVNQFMI